MGILDFFSKEAGQARTRALNEAVAPYIPPELRGLLNLGNELNPYTNIARAGQSAEAMTAPGISGWDRMGHAGNMASEMAAVLAPALLASRTGMPAYQAIEEGLLGLSSGPRSGADYFLADESGGVSLNGKPFYHGTPDGRGVREAGGFSADKPVFLSDSYGMAKTYADDTRAFDYQNAIPEVFTAKTSPQRVLDVDAAGADFRGIDVGAVRRGLESAGIPDAQIDQAMSGIRIRDDGKIRTDDLAKISKSLGFEATDVSRVRDAYNNNAKSKPGTVRMMLDPTSISIDGVTPTTPRSPAQEVADLLASGRAADVTDDMLAKLTPNDNAELFKLYQSGATGADMPMDAASRMQRAEGMGFSTDAGVYHATQSDFPNVDLGAAESGMSMGTGERAFWTTTDPKTAETYLPGAYVKAGLGGAPMGDGVERYFQPQSSIMPMLAKTDNIDLWQMGGGGYPQGGLSSEIQEAAKDGLDGVVFRNMRDPGIMGLGSGNRSNTSIATINPSAVRSRFARFDPRLSHLANLSAGAAGLLALFGLPNDAQAQGPQ